MADPTLTDRLMEIAGSVEPTKEDATVDSPVRSGTGRIRNVRQMNDDKLYALYVEMEDFEEADPDGFAAVLKEVESRGLTA